MILVRSHLLQLNGSRLVLLCLALCLAACAGTRKGTTSGSTGSDVPMVYNPKTGKYEPAPSGSLVDTVKWTKDTGAKPPVTTYDARPEGKRDVYQVSMLMPFNAQRHAYFQQDIDPRTSRFLNYYCGALLAQRDLASSGIKIDLSSADTREDIELTEKKLREHSSSDVIVGPYNRDCLLAAAEFADKKKVPVFSPWTPTVSLERPSEFFVQVTPGLQSHANAAMAFITRHFSDAEVYLVGLSDGSTRSRLSVYSQAYQRYEKGGKPIHEMILPKGVYDYPDIDMTTMFGEENTSRYVFVLPYYLPSDQELINAFLRKLHAEKAESEVYVFGLPQWTSFSKINSDYLESLGAYITSVQHVDSSDPAYQAFVEQYFGEFHAIPEPAAWEGYKLMRFIGKSLDEYGVGFLEDIVNVQSNEGYFIKPVFERGSAPERNNKVLYYQNDEIDVLQYAGYTYRKVQ